MAYTEKFQQLADAARTRVAEVAPDQVDELVAAGAIPFDIRDKEEHDADHIAGWLHVSRGKLEMNPLRQTSCRLPFHADHPRRSDTTCKSFNIPQSS